MPDRTYPRKWRVILRAVRSVTYLLVFCAGIAGIIWTPRTIVGSIGEPLMYWWTSLSAVGALVALVGLLAHRYRVEWAAVYVALGGTIMYAFTVWGIALSGEPTRLVQAFIVTALCSSLLTRAVELAIHAARLRDEHRGRLWTGG